jgi:hypothetical protein
LGSQTYGEESGPRGIGSGHTDFLVGTKSICAHRPAPLVRGTGGDAGEKVVSGGGGAAVVHQVKSHPIASLSGGTIGTIDPAGSPTPTTHREARIAVFRRPRGLVGPNARRRRAQEVQDQGLGLGAGDTSHLIGAVAVDHTGRQAWPTSENGQHRRPCLGNVHRGTPVLGTFFVGRARGQAVAIDAPPRGTGFRLLAGRPIGRTVGGEPTSQGTRDDVEGTDLVGGALGCALAWRTYTPMPTRVTLGV